MGFDPNQARDDHGRWGAGGGASVAGAVTQAGPAGTRSDRFKKAVEWAKTAAVQHLFTGDNVRAAVAIGIKSALYHGLQFDDAMMGTLEDYVHGGLRGPTIRSGAPSSPYSM